MSDMKKLADELRGKIGQQPRDKAAGTKRAEQVIEEESPILKMIRSFDTSGNKSMVHVRFDAETLKVMTHFKLVTGVDISKFVAFSVAYILQQEPELKALINQHFKNLIL